MVVDVFETGFHLYRCRRNAESGDIDPPARMEVMSAFYLAPKEFEQWRWRFPDQQRLLQERLESEPWD